MLRDLGFDHLGAELPDGRQSSGLVLAHETAVARHIGGEDGSEAALNGSFCHWIVFQIGPVVS